MIEGSGSGPLNNGSATLLKTVEYTDLEVKLKRGDSLMHSLQLLPVGPFRRSLTDNVTRLEPQRLASSLVSSPGGHESGGQVFP
jgi:hypothetical protein